MSIAKTNPSLGARLRSGVAVLSLALAAATLASNGAHAHRRDGDRHARHHKDAHGAGNDAHAPVIERAHILQSRHDFAGAEALLSQLLALQPNRHDARLMRAQIRLHLRRPDDAMRDCAALMSHVDLATGVACVAQARAALGDVARAYELVVTALEGAGAQESPRNQALGWSANIAGELAARLGRTDEAAHWHRLAYRLDPDNHFIRDGYAKWESTRRDMPGNAEAETKVESKVEDGS